VYVALGNNCLAVLQVLDPGAPLVHRLSGTCQRVLQHLSNISQVVRGACRTQRLLLLAWQLGPDGKELGPEHLGQGFHVALSPAGIQAGEDSGKEQEQTTGGSSLQPQHHQQQHQLGAQQPEAFLHLAKEVVLLQEWVAAAPEQVLPLTQAVTDFWQQRLVQLMARMPQQQQHSGQHVGQQEQEQQQQRVVAGVRQERGRHGPAQGVQGQQLQVDAHSVEQTRAALQSCLEQLEATESNWKHLEEGQAAPTQGHASAQIPQQQQQLDPAQVLAAAQACFGGLHQAAQQLQALGEGFHQSGASMPQQ
jgi:hypothetical protein